MMSAKIYAAAIFVLLALLPHAFADTFFYSGYLEIALEKNSYGPGEKISGVFTVGNFEGVAFNDGYIVAQLIEGGADSIRYPSQLADSGNIFLEQKFPAKLLAGKKKEIPFEMALPATVSGGKYTLSAYFMTQRTPVTGVAYIFLSPVSSEFNVASGTEGGISIQRTTTKFANEIGPIGAQVMPSEKIPGNVYITNKSARGVSGIEVWAGLCDWDDTSCPEYRSVDSKTIDVPANGTVAAELELSAPQKPGAYAIRIEARSGGKLLSLYRSRAIVTGESARIKRLEISSQKLEAGKEYNIGLLLGSSPDHYTKPDLEDVKVRVFVTAQGDELFSQTLDVNSLPFAQVQKRFDFKFKAARNVDAFRVCSNVSKQGTELDSYCFDVEPEGLSESGSAGIDVRASYSAATGKIGISICGYDAFGNSEALDIYVLLRSQSQANVIDAPYNGATCYVHELDALESSYRLVVDDYKNSEQHSKDISLELLADEVPSCSASSGVVCSAAQKCDGTILEGTQEMACCIGICSGPEGNVDILPGQDSFGGGKENETAGLPGLALPAAASFVIIVALLLLAGMLTIKSKKEGDDDYEKR